jgi:hypothetical protein
MAKRKKKAVHWSKLPRAKLVVMVRRLQADKTKLQLQLSQARETKLLNMSELDRQSPAMREAYGVNNNSGAALDDLLEKRATANDAAQEGKHWSKANDDATVAALQNALRDGVGIVHVTQEEYGRSPARDAGLFPWEQK